MALVLSDEPQGSGPQFHDCSRCHGTGAIRNPGDTCTTTVEAAAAYEQMHPNAPSFVTCKRCKGEGRVEAT